MSAFDPKRTSRALLAHHLVVDQFEGLGRHADFASIRAIEQNDQTDHCAGKERDSCAAAESRAKLDEEFDWLDDKLADGRDYLDWDRFSRADLTVASLLANFARPRELSAQHGMPSSSALAADVDRWSKRPVMRWVTTQYEMHRGG